MQTNLEDTIFGIPKVAIYFVAAIVGLNVLALTAFQAVTMNQLSTIASQQGKTNDSVKAVKKLLVTPSVAAAKPTPVISVPVSPTKPVYQYQPATKSGQVR